jgi:hypothetical protein
MSKYFFLFPMCSPLFRYFMALLCKCRSKRGYSSPWRNNSKRLFSSASVVDPGLTFHGQCPDVFSSLYTFQNVRSFILNDTEQQTVTDCASFKRRMRIEEGTTAELYNQTISDVFSRYGSSLTWKEKHDSDCQCLCYWAFVDDRQDGICFNDCSGCTCGRPCKRLNWDNAWTDYKLSCKRNEIVLLQTSGNHGLLKLSGVGVSTLADPDSIRLYV